MAIPKIFGIENEYGFSVFYRKSGVQQLGGNYNLVAREFVGSYLGLLNAVTYDPTRESRRKSILRLLRVKSPKESLEDLIHSRSIASCSDWGGFLGNGARFYLDVNHPEYCTPECRLPLDLVAHDKASDVIIREALKVFNVSELGKKFEIVLHKSNSDGEGNSYGTHLNVLMSRSTVSTQDNFRYFLKHYVPFQIARQIFTGGGKLGYEYDAPKCNFQISQRADFFVQLCSQNTVDERPIFNLRDEPHSEQGDYFRLHDISTDALMCEGAMFLRASLSQIVLAMIEDKYLSEDVFPENPIRAIKTVSRDLDFKIPVTLNSGKKMTGLEILRYYVGKCEEYLRSNPMDEQHNLAVALAKELMEQLEKDPLLTFGILDWTTALGICESRPGSAKQNLLKFRELSMDSHYGRLLKNGKIKRYISDEQILSACEFAPKDTRAFLRGELIKKMRGNVRLMNWSYAVLNKNGERLQVEMDIPEIDEERCRMILLGLALE